MLGNSLFSCLYLVQAKRVSKRATTLVGGDMRLDDHASSTKFSVSTTVPDADERRQDKRHLATLRVGKLIAGDREELCLIRNISAGGLMAHVYRQHQTGEHVAVELKTDHQLSGIIVWARDSNIGIQAHEAIDVQEVLANVTREGLKPRLPRLNVEAPVRLKIDGEIFNGTLVDISQGGLKIVIDHVLRAGAEAIITVEGLNQARGVIRWCHDGHSGIAFNCALNFSQLTSWLAARG